MLIFHFTNVETDTERLSNLSKIAQLISSGAGIWNKATSIQNLFLKLLCNTTHTNPTFSPKEFRGPVTVTDGGGALWGQGKGVEGRAGDRKQKSFWFFEIANLECNLNETIANSSRKQIFWFYGVFLYQRNDRMKGEYYSKAIHGK